MTDNKLLSVIRNKALSILEHDYDNDNTFGGKLAQDSEEQGHLEGHKIGKRPAQDVIHKFYEVLNNLAAGHPHTEQDLKVLKTGSKIILAYDEQAKYDLINASSEERVAYSNTRKNILKIAEKISQLIGVCQNAVPVVSSPVTVFDLVPSLDRNTQHDRN